MQINKIDNLRTFKGYKIQIPKQKTPKTPYTNTSTLRNFKKEQDIMDVLEEMMQEKTFAANFIFDNAELEKTKNYAQNNLLKEGVADIKNAQKIASEVFKEFDSKTKQNAIILAKKAAESKTGREIEIQGKKYYTSIKNGEYIQSVFLKSEEENLTIEFSTPIYASRNPDLFSILSVKTPDYKIYFKSSSPMGCVSQVAKNYKEDDENITRAEKFYNLNDDFLNPYFGIYENAHIKEDGEYYSKKDVIGFSSHYQYKTANFGLIKEAGQLAYFKNKQGEYKYDKKTGWLSKDGKNLSIVGKIPSLDELGKILKSNI